ncbi:MAG TPA: hypothetical protein VFP68_18990 [Burkholderiaceae bacterium]|nr:hypothetical protein [Burkholderiaceae bacterium]
MTQKIPQRIHLTETTLHEGEHAPDVNFLSSERLEIAVSLAELLTGDDCLDVGCPAACRHEFDSIREISRSVRNIHLVALVRMSERDIDAAYAALRDNRRRRIALLCPASDGYRDFRLGLSEDEVIAKATESVRYAKRFFEYVEVVLEDATRARLEFLLRLAHRLVAEGVTCLCLPDTIGCALPAEYGALFAAVRTQLPNISNLEYLHARCHDDLGLALANSLAALDGGANMVAAAINGIGERAGSTSTEELLMVFRTKPDAFPNANTPRYQYDRIFACSRLVERHSGMKLQPHKAIVGNNCYRHQSSVHQEELLKNESLCQAFGPEVIGAPQERIVIGKHSGVTGMRHRLRSLGFSADARQAAQVLDAIKRRLARVKTLSDEQIGEIAASLLAAKV